MCVCPVTPRSNSYVYVEGRGDGGNQNLSSNISRNIPFRAGNQLLEIYIRGLEILILAKVGLGVVRGVVCAVSMTGVDRRVG